MDWKIWWKAAGVRALKTVAQTAIATIGTSAVISEVNWVMVGSASVLAGILSLLTSVAGLPEVEMQRTNSVFKDEITEDEVE
jgi:hypothetical protein